MTALTKDDIHAIRNADDIVVHLNPTHPQGLVRLIKRKRFNPKPFETDQEYLLSTVKVAMETVKGKQALERGVAHCFASESMYHDQGAPASSVMLSLRVGDEVTFSFYPDALAGGYVAAAGLHADVLYVHVYRKAKRHSWKLSTSICPENSARMCRGVPNSAFYERSADERRKLA